MFCAGKFDGGIKLTTYIGDEIVSKKNNMIYEEKNSINDTNVNNRTPEIKLCNFIYIYYTTCVADGRNKHNSHTFWLNVTILISGQTFENIGPWIVLTHSLVL